MPQPERTPEKEDSLRLGTESEKFSRRDIYEHNKEKSGPSIGGIGDLWLHHQGQEERIGLAQKPYQ